MCAPELEVYQFICAEANDISVDNAHFDLTRGLWPVIIQRGLKSAEGCLPLYEYKCVSCGTNFEKIRKFSDPPLTKCEKCGGKLEHLLSSPAFQFKGKGWYVTDYARKSSGSDKADSSNSPKTESSSSDKVVAPSAGESSGSKEHPVSANSKDSKHPPK